MLVGDKYLLHCMANFPTVANCDKIVVLDYSNVSGKEIWETRIICEHCSLWMWICSENFDFSVFLWSIDTIQGLWGQFFYLGNGKTSLDLEGNHCKVNFHSIFLSFFVFYFFVSYTTQMFCIFLWADHSNFLRCHGCIHLGAELRSVWGVT